MSKRDNILLLEDIREVIDKNLSHFYEQMGDIMKSWE